MKVAHFGSSLQTALPMRAMRPLSSTLRSMPARERGLVAVRAESGGLGNFFKKDGSKEDAARKALQEAFAGKKDPFALDEERRKKRGGGDGGGNGGGGGGGGGGGFNFNFGEFSDGFKKWWGNTLRAVAAVVFFFGFICLFYLWRPLLDLITKVVRFALRLDGNPRAQLAAGPAAQADLSKKDGLGNVEESIISKYGGDDDGESEEETDDEE